VGGDLVKRRVEPAVCEHLARGLEDPQAVALGISAEGALAGGRAGAGHLGFSLTQSGGDGSGL
jgi:hypothetical protein